MKCKENYAAYVNITMPLVLLCYKVCTFVLISLALRSVMQYVEVDEPPAEVLASA
jgi:hypothetical protein